PRTLSSNHSPGFLQRPRHTPGPLPGLTRTVRFVMTKRYRDEDDDIDDRPRHRTKPRGGKGKKKKRGPSVGLIVGLTLGGIVLLGGGAVGAVLLLRDRSTGSGSQQDAFPGMLAHWSFDDYQVNKANDVTTIRDSTGRGNNGKLVGARIGPGKKGTGMVLDG